MSVIASLTDCLTIIANIGISYFVAIASIVNLSVPIPPIAAPNPNQTVLVIGVGNTLGVAQ
jgi:hypothetical protein